MEQASLRPRDGNLLAIGRRGGACNKTMNESGVVAAHVLVWSVDPVLAQRHRRGCTDAQTHGRKDERTYGRTDAQEDPLTKHGLEGK